MGVLLAASEGGAVVQFVVIAIVVVGFLLAQAAKKSREKEQKQWGTPADRMQSHGVKQRDMLTDVRQFFENIQAQEQVRQEPASVPPPVKRQHRRVVEAAPVEGEEGPTHRVGRPLDVDSLKHSGTPELKTSYATEARTEHGGLQALVGDTRLSAGARAVVLMEIMGPPRSVRPYQATSEGN
jgi:hypothetical protein